MQKVCLAPRGPVTAKSHSGILEMNRLELKQGKTNTEVHDFAKECEKMSEIDLWNCSNHGKLEH